MYGATSGSSGEYTALSADDPAPSTQRMSTGSSLSVPREYFKNAIARRADRAAHCRYVPIAILTYVVACYLIILHGHVQPSNQISSALQAVVVNGWGAGFVSSVTSQNAWVDYFAGDGASVTGTPAPSTGWIATILPQVNNGRTIGALNKRGRVGSDFNVVLGGVRLSQTRRSARACSLQAIRSVYGSCSDGPISTASFITLANSRYEVTLPSDGTIVNVNTAFNASDDRAGRGKTFQWILDSSALPEDNQMLITGLDSANWLDPLTDTVLVETVFLSGELGYYARVGLTSTFTSSGLVENTVAITVFPADPYATYPQLLVLDTFAIFFWIYLVFSMASRVLRDVSRKRPWSVIFSLWRAYDVGAIVALLVAILQYANLLRDQKNIGLDPQGVIRNYQDGASNVTYNVIRCAAQFLEFKKTLVWVVRPARLRPFMADETY